MFGWVRLLSAMLLVQICSFDVPAAPSRINKRKTVPKEQEDFVLNEHQ